jgi:prepilin-type N-terminal cleavage/methylation domain-containing protein
MRTLSTNSSFGRRSRRAFTFVELMVVTLLIALLAGSSIRGSIQTFRKMQVERAAREVFLAAQFARVQAVDSQRSCEVMLDPKTRSVHVAVLLKKGQQLVRNAYSKPYQFSEDVTFERIDILPSRPTDMGLDESVPNTMISFHPDGSADAAVVQVGNGKTHWTLYVSSGTGMAKTELGPAKENAVTMVVDLDLKGK